MKNTINLNEISYNELMARFNEYLAQGYAYMKAIASKREEEMKKAVSSYKESMAALGFSEEQMKDVLDNDISIINDTVQKVENQTHPETLEVPQYNEKDTPALLEPTWEKGEVTLVEEEDSTNPENNEEEENKAETASVWYNPALTAPYNPVVAKKSEAPAASEKTPVENADEELPSLEDLLSDDPEYKEYYASASPVKKNNRNLPSLDELLSGEPINRILCLGNLEPKGAAYRQHSRVCDPDGIIPTETATGQTLIYIPPVPPVAS